MAFAFSKYVPCLRGEPSLHFIRVAVRGRRDPPPPTSSSWAFVGPRPFAPPSRHTLTPAAALVTAGARPGAGPGDAAAAAAPGSWPRGAQDSLPAPALGAQSAWGRSGPRRGAGRPVRTLVLARPPLAAGPRAPVPPHSLGKQRPGAILGRRGWIPGPVVGAARTPAETSGIRRAPLGIPCQASGSGEAPSLLWRTTLSYQSQAWAPCAGCRGGAGSAVRPGLAAIFSSPSPRILLFTRWDLWPKSVLTQCMYVCVLY